MVPSLACMVCLLIFVNFTINFNSFIFDSLFGKSCVHKKGRNPFHFYELCCNDSLAMACSIKQAANIAQPAEGRKK